MTATGWQGGCGGTEGLGGGWGPRGWKAPWGSACPQTHGLGCRLWLSPQPLPRKITIPTCKAWVRGQDVPHVPRYPPPIMRAAGWEFARLSPTFPAGSRDAERLPWQLLLRGKERSRTRGSPRGERHDTAGGRLPVTRSWGRTALFPSLTSGPRVPAGWERTPPNEPNPTPTCHP